MPHVDTARILAFCRSALLTLLLTACTSWQVAEVTPKDLLAQERPRWIRVARADAAVLVLREPQITGDTLVGVYRAMSPNGAIVSTRMAIPLTEVREISVRRGDPAKTVVLILNVVLVTGIYVYLAGISGT